MTDPLLVTAISTGLGLMFLSAAYHKLSNLAAFRVTLLEYQLLPAWLVPPASRIAPMLELLLGGTWLLPFAGGSITAIVSASLLGLYALAIGINLYRGRVHFDCGCGFGGKNDQEQFLSGGLIGRNVALIAAALVTLLPAGNRALGAADYVTLTAILLAAMLLFITANQLIANRASINAWRNR